MNRYLYIYLYIHPIYAHIRLHIHHVIWNYFCKFQKKAPMPRQCRGVKWLHASHLPHAEPFFWLKVEGFVGVLKKRNTVKVEELESINSFLSLSCFHTWVLKIGFTILFLHTPSSWSFDFGDVVSKRSLGSPQNQHQTAGEDTLSEAEKNRTSVGCFLFSNHAKISPAIFFLRFFFSRLGDPTFLKPFICHDCILR